MLLVRLGMLRTRHLLVEVLKTMENEIQDHAAGSLKDSGDTLLDANELDESDGAQLLAAFMVGARETAKSWRSYSHNFSKKVRTLLEASWQQWSPHFDAYMNHASMHNTSGGASLSRAILKNLCTSACNFCSNKEKYSLWDD